jgi:hypothetical protein
VKVTPGPQFPIPAGDYAVVTLRSGASDAARNDPSIIDASYTVVDPFETGSELVPHIVTTESAPEPFPAPPRSLGNPLHPAQAYARAQRGLGKSPKGAHLDVVA